jgi:aryl-alcohol dehydrogenase-like predicted oxidoreductase
MCSGAHRIRIRLLLPAGLDRGAPRRRNLELVQRVREIAGEKGVTPAQLALAWVLSRGEDVVPIPGTKHVRLLEENLGAVDVQLEPGDLTRIEEAFPKGAAAGDRYADMSPINR